MHYRNSEMKVDQLIGYFNEDKINLIPPFQRGHVWTLPLRRKLMRNMVNGLPIPAIFLYKEASGSKYSYNILDGKQRLESLLLFVGNEHDDVRINNVAKYFVHERERRSAGFSVEIDGKKVPFADLPEDVVRDFREYAIPTIEISLTDDSTLDEIIDLFIDINQQGVEVNRFDIVKAMAHKNPLLESVFDLVAEEQKRQQDIFYRKKNNEFTKVFERLEIIQNLSSPNSRVDRIWERLLELAVFCRTREHRAPVQILKSFIRSEEEDRSRLTAPETRRLRDVFRFLRDAYRKTELGATRFATDQTHFYTMVTTLLAGDLLSHRADGTPPDKDGLRGRLVAFAQVLDGAAALPREQRLKQAIKEYQEMSRRQTTHVGRRRDRQRLFAEILNGLTP